MAEVIVLFADGFETVEGLMVVDVLRRAGIGTRTVSISQSREVTSAQNITIVCDATLSSTNTANARAVVLPGGMPGAERLKNSDQVRDLVVSMHQRGHIVAAICAAPIALAAFGILDQAKVTSFPGFEQDFPQGVLTDKDVVVDNNIITARSMGFALPFSLEIVRALVGDMAVQKIETAVYCK